jgi:lipopolysaccharide biosynthesis glycosyltransferase
MKPIPIFVGYDPRESIAYHVFCQSVLEKTSLPVTFIPLALNSLEGYVETHKDGSNDFIYSRFLVPYLMDYQGFALFADGDMTCNVDIAELWKLRDYTMAVQVVKHDYKTKHPVKYLGAKNEDYPRKNWSSLILWNCGNYANRKLTPGYIENHSGQYLHRFSWIPEDRIGNLPIEWNWLDMEYDPNPDAYLTHHTVGSPCFKGYEDQPSGKEWYEVLDRAMKPLNATQLQSKLD